MKKQRSQSKSGVFFDLKVFQPSVTIPCEDKNHFSCLQISWTAWRKMMYGFWITVIAYSVAMLILVYTYQFSNFPGYWTRLGIDEAL